MSHPKKRVGRPKGRESSKVTITAPDEVWAKFTVIRSQNKWTQAECLEELLSFWEGQR